MTEWIILISAGLAAGLLGGLLGIGGGIVLMPVLRFAVGLPPAQAARTCVIAVFFTTLVREFGPEHVQISDLNPHLRGTSRFGISLMDGRNQILKLIRACGKRIILFGFTGASVCSLMNLERWCPKAQQGVPC